MKASSHSHPFKCMGHESWKHLFLLVLVYGFEELLRVQFFKCPCTNYSMYSLAMLTAPGLFLLAVGVCVSGKYWTAIHTRRNMLNYKQRINYCLKSLPSLFEPFFPLAAFIVLVLLKGEYYACAKIGNSSTCGNGKGLDARMMSSKPEEEMDRQTLYSQSQLLGCGVMAGVTVFALGIVFIRGCFFTREVIPDLEEYFMLQNKLLVASFREKLEKSIEKEIKRDIEEAFDSLGEKGVEVAFKKARDRIKCKKSFSKIGRFTRLTENEDSEINSIRIIDSSL